MKKLLSIFIVCILLFLPACTQSEGASPNAETISGQDLEKPLIEVAENDMMPKPDDLKEDSSSQNSDMEPQYEAEEDEPETFQSGDFTYILLDDGTAEITDFSDGGPNGSTRTLSIPNELDGHQVTSIGDNVFYLCSQLTDITIPDSVTSIGNSAFSRCYSLHEITIPDSVTKVGTNPFAECDYLTTIYVSPEHSSLHVIDNVLFSKEDNSLICYPAGKSASEYEIPQGTLSIGDYAFHDCDYLNYVMIPDSVTSIGDHAFTDCSDLVDITIPRSVTSIGHHAFSDCNDLADIVIPDGISSINPGTFSYCRSLRSVTIPDSVTSIGDYAFDTCYSLTSITIPNSVTSIGNGAFGGCESLTSFTIPDGVTSIENDTFAGCSNLAHITIPNSVTSIGDYAFATCDRLYSITIPDSVTSISSLAFNAVDNITLTVSRGSYAEQYCTLNGFQYEYDVLEYDTLEYTLKNDGTVELTNFNGNEVNTSSPQDLNGLLDSYIKIPVIDRKIAGANKINKEISAIKDHVLEQISFYQEQDIKVSVQVDFDSGIHDNILSLCISSYILSNYEEVDYYVFNYSLKNGKSLGHEEILGVAGISEAELTEMVSTAVLEIYDNSFLTPENYQTYYDLTMDPDEIAAAPLFFNSDDQLCIMLTVAYPAGGGSYKDVLILTAGSVEESIQNLVPEPTEEIVSGYLGENVLFSIYSNGVLEVSGQGEMYGFLDMDVWLDYSDDIKYVVVKPGVSSVGAGVFASCQNLEVVVLGERVRTVSAYAFSGCTSLRTLVFYDSLIEVQAGAFLDCNSLADIYCYGQDPSIRRIIAYPETGYLQGQAREHYLRQEKTAQSFLSTDDAYRIASDYWQVESGDVDEETGFTLSIVVYDDTMDFNGRDCYAADLKWFVEDHYSRIDYVYIDALTGECYSPY